MSAVPLLKEVKMAPEVLAAWERHQAVKGYADDVRQHLKILLELQLRENLKQENPGWSKQKCVAGARGKAQEMAGKFGKNRAEWEEYWTGVLKAPEPKP